MAATKADIKAWLEQGKAEGATHTIIVCDTFDYDDYPVNVFKHQSVREKCDEYSRGEHSMQKVMEVYALHLPLDEQLEERRSFHYESAEGDEDGS